MEDFRQPPQKANLLDISWGSILKLSAAILLLYLTFLLKDILVWVLFGVIISLLFNPAIDFLQRFRVPRAIGALALYLSVFGLIGLVMYGISPLFIEEIKRFSQLLPQYVETLAPILKGLGVNAFSDAETFFQAIVGNIEKISANFFAALFGIFGGIFSTFFVISIAIFLSIDSKSIERTILLFFPRHYEAIALDIWGKAQKKVSAWFLSRILGSLFVGGAVFFMLLIFDVPYPSSLALFNGLFNFIPLVGPLASGLVTALLVALDSLPKALFVALALFLIQQIEGNILTPLLTKRFIGLSPALVLVSIAVGGELWGIMGALLAIPIAGILAEFLKDFLKKRKEARTVVL